MHRKQLCMSRRLCIVTSVPIKKDQALLFINTLGSAPTSETRKLAAWVDVTCTCVLRMMLVTRKTKIEISESIVEVNIAGNTCYQPENQILL